MKPLDEGTRGMGGLPGTPAPEKEPAEDELDDVEREPIEEGPEDVEWEL